MTDNSSPSFAFHIEGDAHTTAGRVMTEGLFAWPGVLRSYGFLTADLAAVRVGGTGQAPQPWHTRTDPFARFEGFATRTTTDDETVTLRADADAAVARIAGLTLANYAFQPTFLEQAHLERLVAVLRRTGPVAVGALLAEAGEATPPVRRALAWLFKFGVVEIG